MPTPAPEHALHAAFVQGDAAEDQANDGVQHDDMSATEPSEGEQCDFAPAADAPAAEEYEFQSPAEEYDDGAAAPPEAQADDHYDFAAAPEDVFVADDEVLGAYLAFSDPEDDPQDASKQERGANPRIAPRGSRSRSRSRRGGIELKPRHGSQSRSQRDADAKSGGRGRSRSRRDAEAKARELESYRNRDRDLDRHRERERQREREEEDQRRRDHERQRRERDGRRDAGRSRERDRERDRRDDRYRERDSDRGREKDRDKDGRPREHERDRDRRDHGRDRETDEERQKRKERERERDKVARARRHLEEAIKDKARRLAIEAALTIAELKQEIPQNLMRAMLENAAAKPGVAEFVKTLQVCVVGKLQLDPNDYCRLIGILLSRETSQAQVRMVLNMALPKNSKPIPLVSPDLKTEAELKAAFQDITQQEDGEADSEAEGQGPPVQPGTQGANVWAGDTHLEAEREDVATMPEFLDLLDCEAIPELNGRYIFRECYPETLGHDRPVYVREADELLDREVFLYYYEHDPERPWLTGWWLAFDEIIGSDVIAYNASSSFFPPRTHWQVYADGQRRPDVARFLADGVDDPAPIAATLDEAESILHEVDLRTLQGMLTAKAPQQLVDYFGHFMSLLHLEHMAEVGQHRRRLLRVPIERLQKFGWALANLPVMTTFGRQESKRGLMPGWKDKGRENVVFLMPEDVNVERLRFGRGENVVVSRTDPLKDRIADGTVVTIDSKKITILLSGEMPKEDGEARFRVDATINRTVYERQLVTLKYLGGSAAKTLDPMVEMLVSADVGKLDAWAEKAMEPPWKRKRTTIAQMQKDRQQKCLDAGSSRCAELAESTFMGLDETKAEAARSQVDALDTLNDSQREAVLAALKRRCTIVQGPPGTGKTTCSVQILATWAKTMGNRPLLATSDSNTAVDNIADGLHRLGIKVARVGRREKVREQLDGVTLESLVEARRNAKEKEAQAAKEAASQGDEAGGSEKKDKAAKKPEQDSAQSHQFQKRKAREAFELKMEVLQDMEVICATTMATGSDFFSRLKFHGILIDEVAQATEISALVPIVLRNAKQVALVGDQCQLPPAVMSREAELRGLSLSVYSRLMDGGVMPFFLDTQYRSHPMLAAFSAKCFYHGQLESGISEEERPPPEGVPWPNPDVPVAFFEIGMEEHREGESKANQHEADAVRDLVLDVLEAGELEARDIGIVTPYMAQVRLLRQYLRKELQKLGYNGRELEIASVDQYQGREKELIIFSAVRSNRRGNVGFLADWRRLNVMLTRSRRGLVVLGSANTLRHDPHWQQWLEFCSKHDAVGHAAPVNFARRELADDAPWLNSWSSRGPQRVVGAAPPTASSSKRVRRRASSAIVGAVSRPGGRIQPTPKLKAARVTPMSTKKAVAKAKAARQPPVPSKSGVGPARQPAAIRAFKTPVTTAPQRGAAVRDRPPLVAPSRPPAPWSGASSAPARRAPTVPSRPGAKPGFPASMTPRPPSTPPPQAMVAAKPRPPSKPPPKVLVATPRPPCTPPPRAMVASAKGVTSVRKPVLGGVKATSAFRKK
eukprot:TRINITY_DN24467_c0_g1_i2.p1 TRINITY_DN24467_c0_g1~~TRINITY_DN24467_c0_g1_i2.p1  ORF type:complete len:1552 (+),score=350.85 TRINITY_DN24467_c0_g1_i2:87-4742(+)